MPSFLQNIKKSFKKLTDSFLKKINSIFKRKRKQIEFDIRREIRGILKASPTYDSLIDGDLRGHFGFPQGQEREIVESLVDELVDTINIQVKDFVNTGNNITGGVEITAIPLNFDTIVDRYFIITEKGDFLPWAEWLFLAGSKPIVIGYYIGFREDGIPQKVLDRYSRSSLAIMLPGDGTFWQVPSEHAGNINNNWVTRAINDNAPIIEKIIREAIEV